MIIRSFIYNEAFCASKMHDIAHMHSRSRLQSADCICPYIFSRLYREYMHCYMLNSYSSFLHVGSVGRYNFSTEMKTTTCIKCVSCDI